jgi:hypothetical protein
MWLAFLHNPPALSSNLPYLLTYYLLTPWTRVLLVSQLVKNPRILWNPKVHYRIHKFPPPVRIPSQLDPVHTPTSQFLKIHFNIIHSSTPCSHKWSFTFRFPLHRPVYTSPVHHTRYMLRPISFFSILSL